MLSRIAIIAKGWRRHALNTLIGSDPAKSRPRAGLPRNGQA